MGGNFKFQVQDSFLEYFFLEIWRFEKRIALSEKKTTFNMGVYFEVHHLIFDTRHLSNFS